MNIGLLMVNAENDVLEQTLASNTDLVDCFYTLDGTVPNDVSRRICEAHPKSAGYIHDTEIGGHPRDGWRQHLLELAYRDHGYDHWFLLLHGDEVWTGAPWAAEDDYDGYIFPLPMFFPRAGEAWDDSVHPLEQLRWNLRPGYPEFRMFRGGPDVAYDPEQHNNVIPSGIQKIGLCEQPINHYLYRSPDSQRERAARHEASGFDPGNYQHITNEDAVYWTDDMIEQYRRQAQYAELCCV